MRKMEKYAEELGLEAAGGAGGDGDDDGGKGGEGAT
jgi:hypothetical protein